MIPERASITTVASTGEISSKKEIERKVTNTPPNQNTVDMKKMKTSKIDKNSFLTKEEEGKGAVPNEIVSIEEAFRPIVNLRVRNSRTSLKPKLL
jgi:hypothetical protein